MNTKAMPQINAPRDSEPRGGRGMTLWWGSFESVSGACGGKLCLRTLTRNQRHADCNSASPVSPMPTALAWALYPEMLQRTVPNRHMK